MTPRPAPPATPDARDVERFRAFVTRRLGLHLDDTKLGAVAEVLARRVDASGRSIDAFLEHLERASSSAELHAVVVELTVNETYFFRNAEQFRAFMQVALPARLRARSGERQLRILSAGCSTGEEAYTLAILLREAALDPSWRVSIVGVDVNHVVLEKAARARYSRWSLRETPDDVRRRWFRQEGSELVLDEEIRRAVTFEERNLVDVARDPWRPGTFDVVFWRNVMMYFTPDHAQRVVDRVTNALVPGGYLFLGHAETLRGVSNDFHLLHTHDTFYYQRKQASERRTPHEPSTYVHVVVDTAASPSAPEPLAAAFDGADSWVDTIHKASQRIRVLSDASQSSSSPPPVAPSASVPPKRAWNVTLALELLEQERFADALALLGALPPEAASDPRVLLLRAVLLTHGGQLARAEEVCHEVLAIDELDAGAHYVLALCREGAGDRRGAVDHDQVAAYLDPAFAMPRLHLGLLSRRADDRESARRDLGQALVLLQREDASRLLLFGGGFGRDALVQLCRAELVACGGTT